MTIFCLTVLNRSLLFGQRLVNRAFGPFSGGYRCLFHFKTGEVYLLGTAIWFRSSDLARCFPSFLPSEKMRAIHCTSSTHRQRKTTKGQKTQRKGKRGVQESTWFFCSDLFFHVSLSRYMPDLVPCRSCCQINPLFRKHTNGQTNDQRPILK